MSGHEPRAERASAYAPDAAYDPRIRLLLDALGHPASDPSVAELHVAICERVRSMRDAGHLPEVVLARIKTLAAKAVAEGGAPRSARPGDAAALVAQVGQWCIAEYFRKE